MDSLSLALAFYRQPFGHPGLLDPATPLPRGIDTLLLLALDARLPDRPAVADAEESSLAARFFVQQVFFVQDASHYRVLGLNPDASEAEIKHHHRLLMRLFHPDRRLLNEAWADSYAQRINEAYTVLRRASQRQRYDLALHAAQVRRQEMAEVVVSPAVLSPQGGHRMVGIPVPRSMRLPPWALRRLPETVLGAVALIALLSVGGVYLSQQRPMARAPAPLAEAGATSTAQLLGVESVDLRRPADPALLEIELVPVPAMSDAVSRAPVTSETPATPVLAGVRQVRPGSAATADIPVSAPRPASTPASSLTPPPTVSANTHTPPTPRVRPTPPPPAPDRLASTNDDSPPASAQAPLVASGAPPVSTDTARVTMATADMDSPVTKLDLDVLTSLFVGAYERGDINGMMALFADQVETNNQVGKRGIRQDYQTLFNTTQRRQLSLTGMQWLRRGASAQGNGIFEVRLEGAEQVRNFAGTLRFEVRKHQNQLSITGFFHRDLYHTTE